MQLSLKFPRQLTLTQEGNPFPQGQSRVVVDVGIPPPCIRRFRLHSSGLSAIPCESHVRQAARV